jgi:hypothetical protein
MGPIPFAFSVHHFISSVGADAGFASIIGLAILILLYFAQARETASLRSHAYEAAERIQQLEARIARQQFAPQTTAEPQITASAPGRAVPAAAPSPTAVPAGGPSPAAVPAGALAPQPVLAGAPAGVGAPALTAATKLIPTVPAGGEGPPAPSPPEPFAIPAPAPATVAAGGAGTAGSVGTAPSNGSAGAGPVAPQRAPGGQAPAPRVPIRPGQTIPPGRRTPPPRGRAPRGGGGSRRIIGIALAALGIVAIVVVLLIVTSGSSTPKSSSSTPSQTTNATGAGKRTAKRSAVNPAAVTVAVLNGTNTTGLAARVAQNLQTEGYKKGAIQTASDQTHSTTVVGYLPDARADALAVAKSLKLKPGSVQAVDPAAENVACPTAGSCSANVIVTVGADLQTTQ